jgi:ADP-ribosyl-[dinitrogen reductase] hydrolase
VVDLKSRHLGMLLGLHAGDSLGAPLEFGPPRERHDWVHDMMPGGGWEAGAATDDTDLMVMLLRSLVETRGRFDAEVTARHFLTWYNSGPQDIGHTTRHALNQMKRGEIPLTQCGTVDPDQQGNGSLMRCAPLALLAATGDALKKIAREQAALTHNNSACAAVDWIFIQGVRDALTGIKRPELYRLFVERSQVLPVLHERIRSVPRLQWDELSTSGWCVDTLVAAVWALVRTESFEEVIVAVVNRGDDADTAGAVAGALAGAFYGACAIPDRWLKSLERGNEIMALYDQFRSFSA